MLFLRWYLWIAPNALLVPCLCGLLKRPSRHRNLWFVSYVAAQLLLFLASVLLGFSSPRFLALYRWVMDALTGIIAVIELGVIYELADDLIMSRSSLGRILRPLMRWTIVVLVLVTAACVALFPQAGVDRPMKAFQVLDFSSSILLVGLLLTVLTFTRALHISWRSLPAGIVLGFAVSAIVELGASPLFSTLGPNYYGSIDVFRLMGFHIAVLIWLVYVFLPSKPRRFSGHAPDQSELQAWDHELQKLMR